MTEITSTKDRKQFADLAARLAWQLGELRHETWTVACQDYDFIAQLAGPGDARLGLHWLNRAKRLRVSGLDPDGLAAFRRRVITVDPSRGLLIITKDVNRRLIAAGYVDDLLAAKAKKAARDTADAERASWLDQAAALFGIGRPKDHTAGDDPHKVYLGRFVKGSGYVESYGHGDGDTGHLNINLSGIPAHIALAMLAVLAGSEGASAQCCYRYGPGHHPDFSVTGCLRERSERGAAQSEVRVTRLLQGHGVSTAQAVMAMDEARASHYQVSEIYDGERLVAVVSFDEGGHGEFTVELARETT
jgi:hypothetical protein